MVTIELNSELLAAFSFIFFFSLLGAFVNELVRIAKGGRERIGFAKLTCGTITGTILTLMNARRIVELGGIETLIGIAFATGLAGFKLAEKLSNVQGFKDFIRYVFEYWTRK